MSLSTITGHFHDQTVASTTWTITHNLGTDAPVVDCWVDIAGTITKIMPLTVVATSSAVVTITFSTAFAGTAQVV